MSKYVENLEEFLTLDYKLEIIPFEEDGEKGFVVRSPEIIGLEVFGETIEEALQEVREAKIALYQIFSDKGIPIKYPEKYQFDEGNFSGRITIRIPKNLHRRIKEYSKQNNVSLNTSIIQLLNDGMMYKDIIDIKERLFEKLNSFNKNISLVVEYSLNEHEIIYYEPSFAHNKSYHMEPKFNFLEN